MKKIIAILLIFSCIAIFAACGKNEEDDGKALETAETYVEITGNAGSIDLDESVAMTLLGIYDKESLGLSKDIYEYELKLNPTRFMEEDACLVEAFVEGEEKAEGTFIILGQQCYVYDSKQQKYLLLTVKGAVELESSLEKETMENSTTEGTVFKYDKANNRKLQDKFSAYSMEKLGLEKEISEYILIVTGTTTTAQDGEKVYIIRLYEKNGETTNYTVAFNQNGNYAFDSDTNGYVNLS